MQSAVCLLVSWLAAADEPGIRVVAASYGANCGGPRGTETASLGKDCDGRRRCDKTVKDTFMPTQFNGNSGQPCLMQYEAEWTCGASQERRLLTSVRTVAGGSRLRLGCGAMELPAPAVPSKAESPTRVREADVVRGRVITPGGVGMARLRVVLGGNSTITDEDGGFTFHGVPKTYDVWITDRDGSRATVYQGLTRRDPVLGHGIDSEDSGMEGAGHRASVASILSATPEPARHKNVWLLSPLPWGLESFTTRTGFATTMNYGWRGDAVLTGTLVALASGGGTDQPWVKSYMAVLPLGLADGDAISADLQLIPAKTGRIAGTVPVSKSAATGREALKLGYVIPGQIGHIDLGTCAAQATYDCVLPDLTSLGGEYCMTVADSESVARASRCGGHIGMKDFSIPAPPPAPEVKAGSVRDTMVAWAGQARVFEVKLGYSFGPHVRVFTPRKSFSWSEFAALGIDVRERKMDRRDDPELQQPPTFVVPDVTVAALSPFRSVDDLASGRGPLAIGSSWQRSTSASLDIPLAASFRVRPQAPQAFDPRELPPCLGSLPAQPVADITPAMVGQRVSLRGILTWDTSWMCTLMGCECCNHCSTNWTIVDDTHAERRVLVQRSSDGAPLSFGALECKRPTPSRIEVMATGKLVPLDNTVSRSGFVHVIDQASLCVVAPAK